MQLKPITQVSTAWACFMDALASLHFVRAIYRSQSCPGMTLSFSVSPRKVVRAESFQMEGAMVLFAWGLDLRVQMSPFEVYAPTLDTKCQ